MHTELTEQFVLNPAGCVLYHGDRRFCRAWVHRVERPLLGNGFRLLPLRSSEARKDLKLEDTELRKEMKLQLAEGRLLGEADAAVFLARRIGLGAANIVFTCLPIVYGWVALRGGTP